MEVLRFCCSALTSEFTVSVSFFSQKIIIEPVSETLEHAGVFGAAHNAQQLADKLIFIFSSSPLRRASGYVFFKNSCVFETV